MKARTLLIAGAILVALAGMTIAGMNSYQQNASRPGLTAVQLSQTDELNIVLMREEEKLARDVYLALYEIWDTQIFFNICESEQQHMDALQRLIGRYGLEDPVVSDEVGQFTNPDFALLYDELVEAGAASLEEAVKVGVLIEELDIEDLDQAVQAATSRSVQRVFQNLLNGSYRHLDAFNRCLEADTTCAYGLGDGTCTPDGQANMTHQGDGTGQRNWP